MSRDHDLYVRDILDACRSIATYIDGVTLEQLAADPMRQDAIARQVTVIGEAASKLPQAVRDAFPNIEWREIVAMRNVLVHAYFKTQVSVLWAVATEDAPELARSMQVSRGGPRE